MSCPKCGSNLPAEAKFCNMCRSQLIVMKKSKIPLFIALLGFTIVIIIGIGSLMTSNITGPPNTEPPNFIIQNIVAEPEPEEPEPPEEPEEPEEDPVLTGAQIFANNEHAAFRIFVFDANRNRLGSGSGFTITPDGIAVTNHHVMTPGVHFAEAVFEDGRIFDIVGFYSYDFNNDLAVIQVDGEGSSFRYMTLGDSDLLRVGDIVYAIGGPAGDPITFTSGQISRLGADIHFGEYFVEGMIQATAAIYGGSSGGALLNDRGHVIGVNAAGSPQRGSVQFAVPINRVHLPVAGAQYNPLPIGGIPAETGLPDDIFFYEGYPFIPDFLSVSQNAELILRGTSDDVGLNLVLGGFDEAGIYHFDFASFYDLQYQVWIADTDQFDDALQEHGFIIQGGENIDNDFYHFFYHPEHNTSVAYVYFRDFDELIILIGRGNAYDIITGNITPTAFDPLLLGEWVANVDIDLDFGYGVHNYDCHIRFFSDGTGESEFILTNGIWNYGVEFTWNAENGILVMTDVESGIPETLTYSVSDNILTISMQGLGVAFERRSSGVPIRLDTVNLFHLDNRLTLTLPTLTFNGVQMYPVLETVVAFGGEFNFDKSTRIITIELGNTRIEISLAAETMTINGILQTFPDMLVVDGMLFVPVAILENLNMTFTYVADRVFAEELRIIYGEAEHGLTLPVISLNDEYMYPFRQIAEDILGAAVNWEHTIRTASATLNNRFSSYVIGENRFMDNGSSRNMRPGIIPFIFAERTYMPIRYIVEPLGYTFRYNPAINAIFIE